MQREKKNMNGNKVAEFELNCVIQVDLSHTTLMIP
jgi:hypothetical protein